jgi:hypothetical protein
MSWTEQLPTSGGATEWDSGTTTWDSGTTTWDAAGAGWSNQSASSGTWTPQAAS